MEGMTYYEILEIPQTASMKQIKKAYIVKAKEWHPDQNTDKAEAADVFKEITKAYETLKDPSKRQIYDLGSNNPNFNDSATSEDYSRYYEQEEGRERRPYWQNKWNGFKKPASSEDDLRDHYDNYAKNQRLQEEWEWKSVLIKLGVIASIFVLFDILRYRRTQKHKEVIDLKKEILTAQFEDQSKEIDANGTTLNDYISIRMSEIEEQESGFDSGVEAEESS